MKKRRKIIHRESKPKDIQRFWNLATRLEYKKTKKNAKKSKSL